MCLTYFLPEYNDYILPVSIGLRVFWLIQLYNYGIVYYTNPDGPYGVGHKTLKLKGKTTPSISIFYPIDRQEYEDNLDNSSKTSSFVLEGFNGVAGIAIIFKSMNPKLFQGIMNYRLRAINDAELHSDFKDGSKKMTPVIISHGSKFNRTSHASIAYYLASYGWIVYWIDHTDGSCTYYQNCTLNPPFDIYFEEYHIEDHEISYQKFIQLQMEVRVADMNILIEFIKSEAKKSKMFECECIGKSL